MKIEYEIFLPNDFTPVLRANFADMLSKQGKVQGDFSKKADRCKQICLAKVDDRVVAIGGIKQKTESDFWNDKAGIPDLASEFEWELGYVYTDIGYNGCGIASNVTRLLIDTYGKGNLMATTEIAANPAMVKILEKQGFRLLGKPWRSDIHNNYLGLFLKFE